MEWDGEEGKFDVDDDSDENWYKLGAAANSSIARDHPTSSSILSPLKLTANHKQSVFAVFLQVAEQI